MAITGGLRAIINMETILTISRDVALSASRTAASVVSAWPAVAAFVI